MDLKAFTVTSLFVVESLLGRLHAKPTGYPGVLKDDPISISILNAVRIYYAYYTV